MDPEEEEEETLETLRKAEWLYAWLSEHCADEVVKKQCADIVQGVKCAHASMRQLTAVAERLMREKLCWEHEDA